ncbi:uncharacterized protein EAE98_004634 [Botrytis deweyae]|uniref:Uncharacterized protein n=1 Tax=Botrytis deweyae TaxID=2478750 RepID=A0ABQ7IRT9_9HELO|nr:uncharacterized protein EAE98_004634 [Botrytis deweyae]KAF7931898.1 hypothetical protein EAE98_004634 [Botrytis deweyae]
MEQALSSIEQPDIEDETTGEIQSPFLPSLSPRTAFIMRRELGNTEQKPDIEDEAVREPSTLFVTPVQSRTVSPAASVAREVALKQELAPEIEKDDIPGDLQNFSIAGSPAPVTVGTPKDETPNAEEQGDPEPPAESNDIEALDLTKPREKIPTIRWIDEMLSNYTGLVGNLTFFKKSKKFQEDIIQSLEEKKTYWKSFLATDTDAGLFYESDDEIENERRDKRLNILMLARVIYTALDNLHAILVPYDPSDADVIFGRARWSHREIRKISRKPKDDVTGESNEIRNQSGNLSTDEGEHSNKDEEMPDIKDKDKEIPDDEDEEMFDDESQSGQYLYMGKYWEGLDSDGEKIYTEWREKKGSRNGKWVIVKGPAKHVHSDEDLAVPDIINRETIGKRRRVAQQAKRGSNLKNPHLPPLLASEMQGIWPAKSRISIPCVEWKSMKDIIAIAKISRGEGNGKTAAICRHYAACYAYSYRGQLYREFWPFTKMVDKKGVRVISDEDIKRVAAGSLKPGYILHTQYPDSINAQGKIALSISKSFLDAHSLSTGRFTHKGPRTVKELSSLSRSAILVNSGLSNEAKFDVKSVTAESFGKKQLKQHVDDLLVAKVEAENHKLRMLQAEEKFRSVGASQINEANREISALKRRIRQLEEAKVREVKDLRSQIRIIRKACKCGAGVTKVQPEPSQSSGASGDTSSEESLEEGDISDADEPKGDISEVEMSDEDISDADEPKGDISEVEMSDEDISDADEPKGDISEVEMSDREI